VAELAEAFEVIGAHWVLGATHDDRRFKELAEHFADDRRILLIVEHRGRIVGGALAYRWGRNDGFGATLRAIGLLPGASGRDLGRRLMQTLELEAMRLGIVVIKFGGADRGGRGLLRPHGLHRARVNGVQGTAFVESLGRGGPSEAQNLLSARPASPRGLSGPQQWAC